MFKLQDEPTTPVEEPETPTTPAEGGEEPTEEPEV